MKQKLSVASRILVAFASGALIAVFFLPAWRIDLFAPQYPEGLTMNIWINGLSGEVDVINGLNHYIGMKHITVDMFPEFKFLPYTVGFFMLLGMIVAVTGRTKFLLYYLILSAVGGAAAMIDFYKWEYDYGHNLDPTAPIQVPGMSFQPPLIGHKRILNFDAYSFPDVGGWIVIAAGALSFAVLFSEWWHHRKIQKKTKIKMPAMTAPLLLFASFLVISCNPKPEPFKYGKDNCDFCKMAIVDPKFGGEVVTKKSKVYKFDDVVCMARFLNSGSLNEGDIAKKVVINFEKENDFLDVDKAFFLVSPAIKSPMGSNAAAFATKEAAIKTKGSQEGELLLWDDLYQKIK
ncbi:MAG: nitrous oxide reductase accessory protein NosL [Sphingobacteriales bacterium]|nr:nitrous oxide reductase accessory protein NosL [Sphingobacteriales bacterium]